MRKIRIAIVGVGNCASSLVQGINFYNGSSVKSTGIGLMHREVGGYRPSDIEVVAAFDIDRRKVGLDVSKAIFSPPNCTQVFCESIKLTGAIVKTGCVLDGYPPHMRDQDPLRTFLPLEKESTREDIIAELKNSSAELMVNYLPVGSEQATRFCGQESAAYWRRHQGADGRHYCASGVGRSFSEARRESCADLSAEHGREHRFPEHAESHPAGVEENFENRGGAIRHRRSFG
jgi:myo-inositol-1-phosphate synthase